MSKMDNLRAMREAKYDANAKRTASTRAAAPRTATPVAPPAAASPAPATPTTPDPLEAASDTELCGHRNMSGRTCTRERGHDAKSHRYS